MIYLDNAATSYPKPEKVYTEISKCMREYCANPGRGGHQMSITAGKAVYEARETISSFFNINSSMQLCFTKNATEALNIAIKGSLSPGDHVITTSMEHNSVIRPLMTLEKGANVGLTIVQGNEMGEIDPDDIRKNIRPNTKLIICTTSSNVNGAIMPVVDIGGLAREKGIAFLVDASQGAGILDIDVEKMNIDMLAFPGHKALMGPQGTGGLYVREGLKIKPLLQGGTGSHSREIYQPDFMPDLLESGTLNTPGIVGLRYGIEFIRHFGLENIRSYKHMLVKKLHEGISEIKAIKVYSSPDVKRNTGIAAINFQNADSTLASERLDKQFHIATRAGLHCAPLAHKTLGTVETGIVRLSVGCFNTLQEIDDVLAALREISAGLN